MHPAGVVFMPPSSSTAPQEHDTPLLSVGKECAYHQCFLIDFLLLKCEYCNESFCQDHFRVAAHQCAKYDPRKHDRVAPSCTLGSRWLRIARISHTLCYLQALYAAFLFLSAQERNPMFGWIGISRGNVPTWQEKWKRERVPSVLVYDATKYYLFLLPASWVSLVITPKTGVLQFALSVMWPQFLRKSPISRTSQLPKDTTAQWWSPTLSRAIEPALSWKQSKKE